MEDVEFKELWQDCPHAGKIGLKAVARARKFDPLDAILDGQPIELRVLRANQSDIVVFGGFGEEGAKDCFGTTFNSASDRNQSDFCLGNRVGWRKRGHYFHTVPGIPRRQYCGRQRVLDGLPIRVGVLVRTAPNKNHQFDVQTMNSPLKVFTMPEYLFRPKQLLLRAKRCFSGPPPDVDQVCLPWGQTIKVRTGEAIGSAIWWHGIFDLVVTEAICRLLDAGENALDIGANMGQMTSLLRHVAGPAGRVFSFEPHPALFTELSEMVADRSGKPELAAVELFDVALGDVEGKAVLVPGDDWERNRGVGRIGASDRQGIEVSVRTLDQIVGNETQFGLCKIDVEGHELSVFKGATKLLSQKRIRDVVFEDLDPFPSAVHRMFENNGFAIFALRTRAWKPTLVRCVAGEIRFGARDGTNYLATLEPDRARRRFAKLGWKVLR